MRNKLSAGRVNEPQWVEQMWFPEVPRVMVDLVEAGGDHVCPQEVVASEGCVNHRRMVDAQPHDGCVTVYLAYYSLRVWHVVAVCQCGHPAMPNYPINFLLDALLHRGEIDNVKKQKSQE